jgi:hypothetical protein
MSAQLRVTKDDFWRSLPRPMEASKEFNTANPRTFLQKVLGELRKTLSDDDRIAVFKNIVGGSMFASLHNEKEYILINIDRKVEGSFVSITNQETGYIENHHLSEAEIDEVVEIIDKAIDDGKLCD